MFCQTLIIIYFDEPNIWAFKYLHSSYGYLENDFMTYQRFFVKCLYHSEFLLFTFVNLHFQTFPHSGTCRRWFFQGTLGQLNRTQIGGEFIRYKGSRTTTRTIQRLGTESLAMTELPLRNLDHLPLCHTFYNHLLVAVNQRWLWFIACGHFTEL